MSTVHYRTNETEKAKDGPPALRAGARRDARIGSVPYDRMRSVEAAVLSLLLAEDWPWQPWEVARRLGVSVDLVGICTGRLRADGLVLARGGAVRASLAALRCHELLSRRRAVSPRPAWR